MKTETGFTPSKYDWLLFSVDPVILTIQNNQLCVLLVKRSLPPCSGQWGLPGGRVDRLKHHSLDDSVREKVLLKTGLHHTFFEQVYTEGGADMDNRGWSVSTVYMALVNESKVSFSPKSNSEEVKWWPINQLTAILPLAFWHQKIIETTIDRLRTKIVYSDLPMHFMPEKFTLTQLRQAYELILGKRIESSPFRRRILNADILIDTHEQLSDVSNRPATLYRYKATNCVHIFNGQLKI